MHERPVGAGGAPTSHDPISCGASHEPHGNFRNVTTVCTEHRRGVVAFDSWADLTRWGRVNKNVRVHRIVYALVTIRYACVHCRDDFDIFLL
jgi:hypothetical protein